MREQTGDINEYGKPKPGFMKRVVFRSLGARNSRIAKGPGLGLDNAVVRIGGTKVMLITTDPVSVIPAIGIARSAWLGVHLIASDYATSGQTPEFSAFNFNFPKEMRSSDIEVYLKCVGQECRKLGISIVAGHTGSYPGGGFTVIGGGTMFGFARRGEYVDPSMALPGDAVMMTKGAGIEAASMLAWSFPEYLRQTVGRAGCDRAKSRLGDCSTVDDALIASSVGLGRGAVTSMHDATEGGVLGGLEEMADASGRAFVIEKGRVNVTPDCLSVCSAFRIDPLATVSEGSLLLTCDPKRVQELLVKLGRRGIAAHQIGYVKEGRGLWLSETGRAARRASPTHDRYWSAYERAIRSGLK